MPGQADPNASERYKRAEMERMRSAMSNIVQKSRAGGAALTDYQVL